MASTVVPDNAPHPGKSSPEAYFFRFGTLNLGAYATGGIAVTPAQFGLLTLVHLDLGATGGYVFEYNKTTGKILAYWTGAGLSAVLAEVTNATNLTAITPRFMAYGK